MALVVQLTSKIALVLCSEHSDNWPRRSRHAEYLVPHTSFLGKDAVLPVSLLEVRTFDRMMKMIASRDCSALITVVCHCFDQQTHAAVAFLLGCHLMLSHGHGFEETILLFRPLHEWIATPSAEQQQHVNYSFTNLLRAICCAKCLGWIDFNADPETESTGTPPIDMAEFDHYSRYAMLRSPSFHVPYLTTVT